MRPARRSDARGPIHITARSPLDRDASSDGRAAFIAVGSRLAGCLDAATATRTHIRRKYGAQALATEARTLNPLGYRLYRAFAFSKAILFWMLEGSAWTNLSASSRYAELNSGSANFTSLPMTARSG